MVVCDGFIRPTHLNKWDVLFLALECSCRAYLVVKMEGVYAVWVGNKGGPCVGVYYGDDMCCFGSCVLARIEGKRMKYLWVILVSLMGCVFLMRKGGGKGVRPGQ